MSVSEMEQKLDELCEQVIKELQAKESELFTDINLLDKPFLVKFLRACEYKSAYTAQVIVNYFKVRKDFPDFFQTLEQSPKMANALKSGMNVACPKYNSKRGGCKVFFARPGN